MPCGSCGQRRLTAAAARAAASPPPDRYEVINPDGTVLARYPTLMGARRAANAVNGRIRNL